MQKFLVGAVLLVELLLSGCATSIGTYEQRPMSDGEAIVLVGIDSPIQLSEARYCPVMCVAWYQLGGRKDIMAFPAKVGSTFMLDSVYTTDARAAPLKAGELKIERRGVYYYGTIVGTYTGAAVDTVPHPRLLLAAKRKYGSRFNGLETANFTWPDASNDRFLGLGYKVSSTVQTELRPYEGRRLQLAKVAPPAHFDAACRGGGPISLPDFLPYEEYIRRAFNHELDAAELYDDEADSLILTGGITELAFSTTGESHWKMGMRIEAPNGRAVVVRVTVPFKSSYAAGSACNSAEDAVPHTVQKLIEAVVSSPDFSTLLPDSVSSTPRAGKRRRSSGSGAVRLEDLESLLPK